MNGQGAFSPAAEERRRCGRQRTCGIEQKQSPPGSSLFYGNSRVGPRGGKQRSGL